MQTVHMMSGQSQSVLLLLALHSEQNSKGQACRVSVIADTPELHLACWLAHGTVSVEEIREFGTDAGEHCGKEIVICQQ